MPIEAVIWDYGSVLVRMVDETPRRKLAERLGIRLDTLNRLVFESESARRGSIGEISIAQHWQAIGRILRIQDADLPGVMDEFWQADGLDQDLMTFIRSLRPRYRLGLLSNAWDDLRDQLTQRWQIADAFDDLVISAEVKMQKPDLRIYQLAVDRLGVLPENAVFLDDVQANVDGARQAGLQAIQFTSRADALAQLTALGVS